MKGGRRWDVLGIGDTDVDVFLRVPELPRQDTKVIGELVAEMPGGMVANFCCATSRLDAATALVSVVGDDDHGRRALEDLERHGVDVSMIERRAGGRTYFCIVHLDASGEKALTVVPTDCMFPSWDRVTAVDLAQARLVHLAAVDLELATWIAKQARSCNTLVSLDIEPATVRRDPSATAELLGHVDIATANEAGYRALTGSEELRPRDLLAFGPSVGVITLGSEGSVGATRDGQVRAPGYLVDTIDTTGAGDCFNAALTVSLLHEWPLPRCLEFAGAAAALSVTAVGGHAAAPSWSDTEAFVAENLTADKGGCSARRSPDE